MDQRVELNKVSLQVFDTFDTSGNGMVFNTPQATKSSPVHVCIHICIHQCMYVWPGLSELTRRLSGVFEILTIVFADNGVLPVP